MSMPSLDKSLSSLRLLGRGEFHLIFAARNKTDRSICAVKQIAYSSEEEREAALAEARIHSKLNHKNVVQHKYTYFTSTGEYPQFCTNVKLEVNMFWATELPNCPIQGYYVIFSTTKLQNVKISTVTLQKFEQKPYFRNVICSTHQMFDKSLFRKKHQITPPTLS
jgi:serine/threonine protein kinase